MKTQVCNKLQILNKSVHGILVYCQRSKLYHLLFNNLNFNFTEREFESFYNYLEDTDISFWEEEYKHSIYDKRIPVPTLQSNLIIL